MRGEKGRVMVGLAWTALNVVAGVYAVEGNTTAQWTLGIEVGLILLACVCYGSSRQRVRRPVLQIDAWGAREAFDYYPLPPGQLELTKKYSQQTKIPKLPQDEVDPELGMLSTLSLSPRGSDE